MLNKITVIGNLGTDPEMRYTPSGSAVTNFRMAVSRSYTASDGERREETEWFTIVAWNQLAEQVNQYLSKGRRAYVKDVCAAEVGRGRTVKRDSSTK